MTLFDGVTYAPEHDEARLTGQLERVHELLSQRFQGVRLWWTIPELSESMPGATEASISARIRDLRKQRFGGYLVERRRRGGPPSGCWEYRLGDKGAHPQPEPREPIGADLLNLPNWLSHPAARLCLGCGEDLTRTGLTDLAYTFEPCDCDHATYAHLVEWLWHRTCLVGSGS